MRQASQGSDREEIGVPNHHRHRRRPRGAGWVARRRPLARPLSPRGFQPAHMKVRWLFASPNGSVELAAEVRGLQYRSSALVLFLRRLGASSPAFKSRINLSNAFIYSSWSFRPRKSPMCRVRPTCAAQACFASASFTGPSNRIGNSTVRCCSCSLSKAHLARNLSKLV
jgi:hypothetical protein